MNFQDVPTLDISNKLSQREKYSSFY